MSGLRVSTTVKSRAARNFLFVFHGLYATVIPVLTYWNYNVAMFHGQGRAFDSVW